MSRQQGGYIGFSRTPAASALHSAAIGVWTLREAEAMRRAGTWPVAVTVPGVPRDLAVVGGNGQVSVSWVSPASNGGSPITDYVVQFLSDAGSAWTTFSDGTSTSVDAVVTGLTNGVSHRFRVAAVNAIGTGEYTEPSAAVTPTQTGASVPGVPTSVTITGHPTDCQGFDLRWSAPASDGGSPITGYRIISAARFWGACGSGTSRPNNCGLDVTVSAGTTRYLAGEATGIPGGEPLYIGLFAINAAGSSAEVVVSDYTRSSGGCN